MSWIKDTETAIDIVVARLKELEEQASKTRATTEAELDAVMQSAQEARDSVYGWQQDVEGWKQDVYGWQQEAQQAVQETQNAIGDVVENDLPVLLDNITYQVEQATQDSATRLDDFLFQLEDVAASGNLWAEQLVGVIQQVKDGVLDASQVIDSFGDGMVQFDGELRSVRDVLQDLLPSLGQVRREHRQTAEQLKQEGFDLEDIIGRLRQQHLTYAHDFARLLEAFKQGRATIDAVIQAAQKLKSQFPGSEAGELAGLLQGLLLEDD